MIDQMQYWPTTHCIAVCWLGSMLPQSPLPNLEIAFSSLCCGIAEYRPTAGKQPTLVVGVVSQRSLCSRILHSSPLKGNKLSRFAQQK